MKVQYINPFINAANNLFGDYLEVDITPGTPYLNPNGRDLYEVSGMIGLAGEIKGAIVLSFTRDTAINISSKFAKKKYNAVSSEVIDCIGELVNIVAGNAKQGLLDFRIDISLPGVITGNTYKINWPTGVPIITIPFTCEYGEFSLNVSFRELE